MWIAIAVDVFTTVRTDTSCTRLIHGHVSGNKGIYAINERQTKYLDKRRNVKESLKYRGQRLNYRHRISLSVISRRQITVAARSKVSVAARLLWLRVRIPPGAWMPVSCVCCVLSG